MGKIISFMGLMLVLAGCSSSVKVEDYAANTPTLDIREYLNGNLKAVGAFFSPSGKADPQFTIAMKGAWEGDDGTLKEHIMYKDGRTQDRMWVIHCIDGHRFTATAAGVIGTAQGKQYGNALDMRYTIEIPSKEDKNTKHIVDVDDWIFLMDDKTVINRSQLSKFGFHVGELITTFTKM